MSNFQNLQSNAAWQGLLETMDTMGKMIIGPDGAKSELDALEGYRVLLRTLCVATETVFDGCAERPFFTRLDTDVRKVGGDNPDGEYFATLIDGQYQYKVWGHRGSIPYLAFTIRGSKGEPEVGSALAGGTEVVAHFNQEDINVDEDGNYCLVFSSEQPQETGQWIEIPRGATTILVRQFMDDRDNEQLASLNIECLDQPPVPQVTDEFLSQRLNLCTLIFAYLGSLGQDFLPETKEHPNTFLSFEGSQAGFAASPDNFYLNGWFEIKDDEALVVEGTPPDCHYWAFQIASRWWECFDYGHRQISLTPSRLQLDDKNQYKIVLAHHNPNCPNWVDLANHQQGYMLFRWTTPTSMPQPRCRLVKLSEL
jgi:hypothetical protein